MWCPGVVGNTLIVWIVLCNPRMRNVTNYFIVNLAVADILVCVFCLPITLLSNLLSGNLLHTCIRPASVLVYRSRVITLSPLRMHSSSVGVSDCLSACISAENPDARDSPCTLPVVAARFFSGGVAVCCVLPVCR